MPIISSKKKKKKKPRNFLKKKKKKNDHNCLNDLNLQVPIFIYKNDLDKQSILIEDSSLCVIPIIIIIHSQEK